MKFTKSQIEIYYLRGEHGYWADISIDPCERGGRISISSDWGNWAYFWGAAGESFKRFLASIDIHYFAGKVGESHWVDVEASINNWKKDVLEYRRNNDLDAEKARLMFNELKELEDCDGVSLISEAHHKSELMKFYEYCPDTVTNVSPRFRNFWEKAWKPFVEILKQEITEKLPQNA